LMRLFRRPVRFSTNGSILLQMQEETNARHINTSGEQVARKTPLADRHVAVYSPNTNQRNFLHK
ncbi:Hypothetical predicted protein, partial [Pelobates cultripes]